MHVSLRPVWPSPGLLVLLAIAGCGSTPSATSECDGGLLTDGECAPADPLAAMRAACTFGTGARVGETLGLTPADRAAIAVKHVVVMMKENRSFDHLLGRIHDQQPGIEAIPADFANLDANKQSVAPFRLGTTCVSHDPDHQWFGMHVQVGVHGDMSGFITSAAISTKTDGHFAMGYYDERDLPFYYWLASTYAINDRHFPSVRSGTFPNRNFLLLGTADGVQSTGSGYPRPLTPTIFQQLDAARVTWGVYSDGALLSGTLDWKLPREGAHTLQEFFDALDGGTLPQVTFVDAIENVDDEHPTGDVQRGEAWSRRIYQHTVDSPLWPGMALLWTYDEGGGFFDHVPPPDDACVARPEVRADAAFRELGVRVPLVVISPWARPHFVSHVVQDHTAITRFIEAIFDLPALTARDANSDALLDLFDFHGAPPLMTPPAAPPSGTGGCEGSLVLTADKPVYAPGEPIHISFRDSQGDNPKDWIGLYPYTDQGPTPPQPGALNWVYVGGTQMAGASPKSGTVTLDEKSIGMGQKWPLAKGGYIAYYLRDGGYDSPASINLNIQ